MKELDRNLPPELEAILNKDTSEERVEMAVEENNGVETGSPREAPHSSVVSVEKQETLKLFRYWIQLSIFLQVVNFIASFALINLFLPSPLFSAWQKQILEASKLVEDDRLKAYEIKSSELKHYADYADSESGYVVISIFSLLVSRNSTVAGHPSWFTKHGNVKS
ncbi:hypothetical protein M9H77_22980 [Catharanthus roseus]|uniref:Uncharacterized protein n=1 Tax=Catharanthus roseus TaxID=4058 RepID=A0ACC0ARM3_CATRO|nr:hypothetical protein M9H77_22980 [Catharanthus roseus]